MFTRHDVEEVSNVRIAHDGDLFIVRPNALLRMDPRTGKTKKVTALKYGGPLEISPTHVFAGEDKKVLVVPLKKKTKVVQKLSASGEGPSSITPSPDGRFVLVVGLDEGGTLKCFELGKPRALWTIGSVRYAKTAWTPDGTRFVTASHEWNARVKVHDASKRGETILDLGDPHGPSKKPDESGPSVNEILMDPSGDRIWIGSDEGIASLDLRKGAKADWLLRDRHVSAAALAGGRLIAGCGDGSVLVCDLEKRAILETLSTAGVCVIDLHATNDHIALTIEGAVFYR